MATDGVKQIICSALDDSRDTWYFEIMFHMIPVQNG